MTFSKFHAIKVTEDGLTFDSRAEYRRYRELKLLLAAGEIAALQFHQKLSLDVNGQHLGYYETDFSYTDLTATPWRKVFEDVKGVRTPVYRLKKKLVKAIHGIEIVEIAA